MHAYLILAHHRPDLLKALLDALDDPRNALYLHIDKKSGCYKELAALTTKKARLTIIKPIEVSWGGYSQIKATMHLLQTAVATGTHSYYHLITGASYPLRGQDYLHHFFEVHNGEEFITFDELNAAYNRVRYVQLFSEYEGRLHLPEYAGYARVRQEFIDHQNKYGMDHFAQFGMEIKKGLAYWSISQELASYVVQHSDLIDRMMRYSSLGDEVFMQTFAWNSPFRDRLFQPWMGGQGGLRHSTWQLEATKSRPEHSFALEDLDLLLTSSNLFALKFQGPDGLALIEGIKAGFDDMTDRPLINAAKQA